MKITFLGTGTSQGVPLVACDCEVCQSAFPKDSRLRSSILIEVDHQVIVVDAGPDFRQQMLKNKVKRLDALLLTHSHQDHISGLDDLKGFNYFQRKAVNVYAQKNVQQDIMTQYPYLFVDNKYPGVVELQFHTVSTKPFKIEHTRVIPLEVMHRNLPILGFRVGDFVYITDANEISEHTLSLLQGTKIMVINALRKKPHHSHFNVEQALEVIEKVKPDKAYLTHICHQLGLHEKVNLELPENIELAYDGLTISI